MGGSDNESNLIELSIEEHAEEHRKLYETYGRWEDKMAWYGLVEMVSKEELIKMKLSESGKKGSRITNKNRKGKSREEWGIYSKEVLEKMKMNGFKKGNQLTAKKYLLESPTGEKIEVFGLSKWCRENGFNIKSFHKQVVEKKRQHKGWKLWG